MSFCRRTVEDRFPLERMPLACTLGSPLNLPRGGRSDGPYADSLPLSDHFHGGGGGGGLGLGGGEGGCQEGAMRQRKLGSPRRGGGGRLHSLTNMA